ncbi:MAG: CoA-binding protein, partial [Xanthomarina sp.]
MQKNKKTLVFGASLNPSRYSNMALQKLVAHRHEVVAFGLKEGVVNGVNIDTELKP